MEAVWGQVIMMLIIAAKICECRNADEEEEEDEEVQVRSLTLLCTLAARR